jgi:hypothetical protein
MTREETVKWLESLKSEIGKLEHRSLWHYAEAIDMAIEALKAEPIRCGECKHQDECEEVVLFDVNDDEVIGHRLHWCSYGERKGGGE